MLSLRHQIKLKTSLRDFAICNATGNTRDPREEAKCGKSPCRLSQMTLRPQLSKATVDVTDKGRRLSVRQGLNTG